MKVLTALFLSLFIQDVALSYTVIKGKDRDYHTGYIHEPEELKGMGKVHVHLNDCGPLPDAFDLRDLGTVTSVKDQGSCGSCWAFSKSAALESAVLAEGGQSLDLSEQELVSCDKEQWGCQGGNLTDFSYQIDHGQGLEKDYPYTARNGRCKSNLKVAAKGVSFAYIGAPDRYPTDDELKCALYKTHSVPWIVVDATNAWSRPPASVKTPYTKCGRGETNHAVGVVGWFKDDAGKTQFIMRNSWGEDWGDKGYMSLPLGCDSFGEEAAYIVTESAVCKPASIKLPQEITAEAGAEILLGVKPQAGVEYSWLKNGETAGQGSTLYVTANGEAVYTLQGKTSCAVAQSSVKVKAL